MSAAAESEAGESNSSNKREALLLGELEGLSCKLNGYERALQDCEFELAERELQVVLLKSFIGNLDSPTDLQVNLQEVLEHNTHLQQELACTTSAPPAPANTAIQLSILRAALAEANYRLIAAGLLPVAATSLQDEPRSQEGASLASTFTASTPIIKRSFSRLLHNHSTPSHTSTSTSTSRPHSRTSTSTSSTITPSGSTGSKSSPCAPALSLASKLSEAAPAEGPDTPLGVTSTTTAPRRATSCSEAASSCATTPAPGRAAATSASDLTAAVASSLSAAFSALAAVRPGIVAGGAGSAKSAGDASAVRTLSGFEDVEPYACAAAASDALSDGSSSIASRQSAPASPVMCLLGSPEGKADATPPCSPCSSISCDSVRGSGMRRSYAPPAGLGRSLAAWPGVTCSCDNPLFVAHADS